MNTTFIDGIISTITTALETELNKEVINMRIPGQLKAVLDLLRKKTGIAQTTAVCCALQRLFGDHAAMADLIDMALKEREKAAEKVLKSHGFNPDKVRLKIGE